MVLSLICTSSEINQKIYSQYKIILLFWKEKKIILVAQWVLYIALYCLYYHCFIIISIIIPFGYKMNEGKMKQYLITLWHNSDSCSQLTNMCLNFGNLIDFISIKYA